VNLKKVVGDMGVIGISNIIISTKGILLIPILTRYLGAEGYGLWVQAMATFSVVIPLMVLGLPYSMLRIFPSRDNLDEISKDFFSIYFLVIAASMTVSLLLFFFPQYLADAIFEGRTFIVRIIAIILFVYSTNNLMINVFRAFREMKTFAVLDISYKFGEVVLAAFFVFIGFGLIGALLALLIVRGSMFVILVSLSLKRFRFHLPDLSRTKEYLDFGVPTIPSNISHWIVSMSDRYLIGIFLGATYVGFYNPGYSIGQLIPFIIGGIYGSVLPPTLSEYYEKGKLADVEQVLDLSLKYFFLVSIPFLFGVMLLYEPILLVLTGDATISAEGGVIATYSAFTGLLYGFGLLLGMILVLKKQTNILGIKWTIAAVVNLSANIILIPRLGIQGAAISTVIAYSVATVIAVYYSLLEQKEINIHFDYISYGKILLSSIIMFILLYFLRQRILANVFFLIAIGVSVYFSFMYLIRGIKKEEIRFLKSVIR